MQEKTICNLLELSDKLAMAIDFILETSNEEFNLLSPMLHAKTALSKLISALEQEKFNCFDKQKIGKEQAEEVRKLKLQLDVAR
ncbi:hypothetical protein [Nitrospira sp. BLG_2]|uniref:hypothetical protein n=1 Tax=Nitrospira sp. BLG_2 TaxID=3397507 RepID=UPI003B98FA9A